jgi:hypothetical protein
MKNQNITTKRAERLQSAYHRHFTCQSCDPKWDAQQNLQGINYYCTDDTLRCFSARVQGTQYLGNGCFLMVRSTVGANKAGDSGRYKINIFDLSGTSAGDFAGGTAKEADAAYGVWLESFDGLDYYRANGKATAKRLRREAASIASATR